MPLDQGRHLEQNTRHIAEAEQRITDQHAPVDAGGAWISAKLLKSMQQAARPAARSSAANPHRPVQGLNPSLSATQMKSMT